MAEAAFKQMIATFVRQTRPQTFRHGKPPRYPQRPLATAAAAHTVPTDSQGQERSQWQPHHLTTVTDIKSNNTATSRLEKLRQEPEPKPFSSFLTDNYSREHNYLRISLTERCNLRCLYCMPEEGVELSPPEHILTTPEIVYLSSLFVDQGVNKIRLTGGEPTVRKDILDLMYQIGQLRSNGLKELCLTTNGISLHRKLDSMVESGLTGVNLSLDTLDPFEFTIMTRRNGHEAVMKSINRILEMNKLGAGIKLKINCVVMRGLNDKQIIPFVELGRENDLEVRFIEYMPFDGNRWSQSKMLSFDEMLSLIRQNYPDVCKVKDHVNDTSKTYKIPGFLGRIGFITSMTHNFCGTCNRLRITSDGNLKVCLFGNSEVSLRDILRESNDGKPIDEQAMEAIRQIEFNQRQSHSGSTNIPDISEREARLLDVIGMAVKRKKPKHAGMGELKNMKNRPMILIDDVPRAQQSHAVYQTQAPLRSTSPFLAVRSSSMFSKLIPVHMLSPPHHPSMLQQHRYRSTLLLRRTYITRKPRVRLIYNQPTHRYIPTDAVQPASLGKCAEQEKLRLSINLAARELRRRSPSGQRKLSDTSKDSQSRETPRLTHLTSDGSAHMVDVGHKNETSRSATAISTLLFSNPVTFEALTTANVQKGDALAVARVAGIQAAKKTADLIPLAHPGLGISAVVVDIHPFVSSSKQPGYTKEFKIRNYGICGGVSITARVDCHGKTGVEMEALTAATVTSMTMYDMLKGVDKGMQISGTRVVAKSGGKSGSWRWDPKTKQIHRIPSVKSTSPTEKTVPTAPVLSENPPDSTLSFPPGMIDNTIASMDSDILDDESAQAVFEAEWNTMSEAFAHDRLDHAHEESGMNSHDLESNLGQIENTGADVDTDTEPEPEPTHRQPEDHLLIVTRNMMDGARDKTCATDFRARREERWDKWQRSR